MSGPQEGGAPDSTAGTTANRSDSIVEDYTKPSKDVARLHRHQSSVRRWDGDTPHFYPLGVHVNTFRSYGAGTYLYFKSVKRIGRLFVFMTLLSAFVIILNLTSERECVSVLDDDATVAILESTETAPESYGELETWYEDYYNTTAAAINEDEECFVVSDCAKHPIICVSFTTIAELKPTNDDEVDLEIRASLSNVGSYEDATFYLCTATFSSFEEFDEEVDELPYELSTPATDTDIDEDCFLKFEFTGPNDEIDAVIPISVAITEEYRIVFENYDFVGLTIEVYNPETEEVLWDGTSGIGEFKHVLFEIVEGEGDQDTFISGLGRRDANLIVALIDLFSMFVFMITLGMIALQENSEVADMEWEQPNVAYYTVEVRNLPKAFELSELDQHFTQFGPVADIALAHDFGPLIHLYQKRIKSLIKIEKAQAAHVSKRNDQSRARVNKLEMRLAKQDEKIDVMQKKRLGGGKRVISAFVTFENEIDAHRCFTSYNTGIFSWLFMRRQFRFKGKRLKIRNAPDPTDIVWENYGLSKFSTFFRRVITITLTVAILLVSLLIMSYIAMEKAKIDEEQDVCEDTSYTRTMAEAALAEGDPNDVHYCYCVNLGMDIFDESDFCEDPIKEYATATMLGLLPSICIVANNGIVQVILRALANFERHRSKTSRELSVAWKLAFSLFLNTAVVVWLVSVDTPGEDLGEAFNGSNAKLPSHWDSEWYERFGSAITVMLFINAVSPHIVLLCKLTVMKIMLWAYENSVKTQRELNKLYEGPNLKISERYGIMLSTVLSVMVYSPALPLVYLAGGVSMVFMYWVDKYAFLRIYKKPPRFGPEIAAIALRIMLVGVYLHVGIACWVYSADAWIANNITGGAAENVDASGVADSENGSKILKSNVFVMFFFLCLLLFILLFRLTLGELLLQTVWKCCCQGKKIRPLHHQPMSLARPVIKRYGLDSYDISKNPDYLDAFKSLENSRRLSFLATTGSSTATAKPEPVRPPTKSLGPEQA
eukprot:Rmarinus@m.29197